MILYLYQYKPTSQLNSIPAAAVGFLPDADFSRSVARWAIFLTSNNVVKSPSGRLTIAAGRLFGRQPILSGNDKIFGRCPASVPTMIVQSLGGDHQESCRLPPDDYESPRSPAVHFLVTVQQLLEPHWCALGSILKLIF